MAMLVNKMKKDNTGLWLLIGIGLLFMVVTFWVSNTSFCLNYRIDMFDYMERFKWCATRLEYLK